MLRLMWYVFSFFNICLLASYLSIRLLWYMATLVHFREKFVTKGVHSIEKNVSYYFVRWAH